MTKSVIKEASTIERAIALALEELQMDRDSVSVEVLDKGKSGFLGFGATQAKVKVTFDKTNGDAAIEFIAGLLAKMGIEGKGELVSETDDVIAINIITAEMGAVIGRRGDTLDAIQYITSLVVNKDREDHVRVNIDIENYRQKREESLERLAVKIAGKVLKYKKSMTLEPMSPYERRIIHAKLQDYPGVTTHSTGTEPNRRVVVTLAGANKKEGFKPAPRRPFVPKDKPKD